MSWIVCLKLQRTMLFVFVNWFGSVDFACFRLMFRRLNYHFTQKLFVYELQLEHQLHKFYCACVITFLNLSNLSINLRSSVILVCSFFISSNRCPPHLKALPTLMRLESSKFCPGFWSFDGGTDVLDSVFKATENYAIRLRELVWKCRLRMFPIDV